MTEALPQKNRDRSFFLILAPLAAASFPSLIFCALALVLSLHGVPGRTAVLHGTARSTWEQLLALELSAYRWVARWNSFATLAATAFFVSTLLQPRWRHWTSLALIPYGLLLCADFTLRWRSALIP